MVAKVAYLRLLQTQRFQFYRKKARSAKRSDRLMRAQRSGWTARSQATPILSHCLKSEMSSLPIDIGRTRDLVLKLLPDPPTAGAGTLVFRGTISFLTILSISLELRVVILKGYKLSRTCIQILFKVYL